MLPLKKYILAAIALALICSQTLIAQSFADDDAPVKRGGFKLSAGTADTIQVLISSDGSQGEIQPRDLNLLLNGKINFRYSSGYIERAGVFAGVCARKECGPSHQLLWYKSASEVSDLENSTVIIGTGGNINVRFPTLPAKLLSAAEQVALINQCKAHPTGSYVHWSTVTLSVNTRTSAGTVFLGANLELVDLANFNFNGGDQSRDVKFPVLVVCTKLIDATQPPIPKTPANQDLGFDHGSMKVKDIRLTFTTFQNGYTEPTPGTRCKKARLRVRMETNQKGPVSFKLWQQRGGGNVSSNDHIIGSHHDGNGRFFAQKDFDVRVYKTTLVQAKARELISETFKKETDWKKIHLICKGAGGNGGLATPDNDNDNDDNRDASEPVFKGAFQLFDNSSKAKQNKCSRQARAYVWFTNNKPDNIHYSLDCGALGNFSGIIAPQPTGDGKYSGNRFIPFTIEKSIQAGCTLRTVAPGVARNHAFMARNFMCHKTTGQGSGNGLATPPRPTRGEPKTNGGAKRITEPVRTRIQCFGGKLRANKCQCGLNKKRVRVSAKVFKCVKRSKRVNPQPPTRVKAIVCVGGKVRANKCVCRGDRFRRKIGPKTYRCLKRQAKIKCVGGTVRGRKCYCPPRTKVKRKARNTYVCAKKARPTRVNPTAPKRVRPRHQRCLRGKVLIRGKCRRI